MGKGTIGLRRKAGLEAPDDVQGKGQEDNLVQNLEDELHQHHIQDADKRDGAQKGQGEEYEGIGRFPGHGTHDEAQPKAVLSGTLFHPVQDQNVEVTAHQERDTGGQRNPGRKAEDSVETLLVGPRIGPRQGINQGGDANEQEIQDEAGQDEGPALAESPYLADAVADDVADGENEQTARDAEGAGGYLFGLKDIGSDERHNEHHTELCKDGAHRYLFFLFWISHGSISIRAVHHVHQ